MSRQYLRKLALFGLCVLAQASQADSSCSAENPDQGQTCSVSCSTGQTARCENASGNGYPYCECEGEPQDFNKSVFFSVKKPASVVPAVIEKTDALAVINQKLAPFNTYPLAENCANVKVGRRCDVVVRGIPGCPSGLRDSAAKLATPLRCGSDPVICRDIFERRCSPSIGALTARAPFFIEQPPQVRVDEPNWNAIPSSILGLKKVYRNCSSIQQSQTFRHTETVRTGTRVVKTRTVDIGSEISATLSFSFVSPGSSMSAKFSNKTSTTNTNEENYESTQAIEETIPLLIPPKTKLSLTHTFIQREVPVNYSGTVQLDAAASENLAGIKLISQVLTDPKDRQFVFSGTVLSASISDGYTNLDEEKLSDADCRGLGGLDAKSFPFVGEPGGEKSRGLKQR